MSGLFKEFKMNTEREINGFRVEPTQRQNPDGTLPVFILARMGGRNKEYAKARDKEFSKRDNQQLASKTMPDDVFRPKILRAFIKSVLKGWENVFDEFDSPIPYSQSAATELLTELPDLADILIAEASDEANFKESGLEADAKN